jgi:RimJ/RimL family protein N-acetyltransferase
VGYWVRRSQQGRGIARAAASTLTRRAFTMKGVVRVEIWTDPGNEPSSRLAASLGFVPDGTRETTRADGSRRIVDAYRRDDPDGLPSDDVQLRNEA